MNTMFWSPGNIYWTTYAHFNPYSLPIRVYLFCPFDFNSPPFSVFSVFNAFFPFSMFPTTLSKLAEIIIIQVSFLVGVRFSGPCTVYTVSYTAFTACVMSSFVAR
jgi:hypothetical protein